MAISTGFILCKVSLCDLCSPCFSIIMVVIEDDEMISKNL